MRRDQQYEVLLKRSEECERLSQVAIDLSVRRKCAELAIEYRDRTGTFAEQYGPSVVWWRTFVE
jgi:hypothetical protein